MRNVANNNILHVFEDSKIFAYNPADQDGTVSLKALLNLFDWKKTDELQIFQQLLRLCVVQGSIIHSIQSRILLGPVY